MKKFLDEFKEFALRGNALNLAIGVIIGAAFQSIVTALTETFISPILEIVFRVFLGDLDIDKLSEIYFPLFGAKFYYGQLILALINFLITALVLFFIVRTINRITPEQKEEEKPDPCLCPFCLTEVDEKATRCPHCTSVLEPAENEALAADTHTEP